MEEGGEVINVVGQEADGWRRNLATTGFSLTEEPASLKVWGVSALLFRGAYLSLPQLEKPEKGPLACCKDRLIMASGPAVME